MATNIPIFLEIFNHDCVAKFLPYEFQDLCLGKTIDSTREVDELYYFEFETIMSIKQAQ